MQYQNILASQLKQQKQQLLSRSQSMQQNTPSNQLNRQLSLQTAPVTLNDLCNSPQISSLLVAQQLPQQPCVTLQRRDSVKSDGSQNSAELAPSRYKTELCRPFEETGHCRYGSKCQFAHGMQELRSLNRHPRYKTELCRTFHTTGFCSYGQRCNFIHNEEERRGSNPSSQQNRPQALNLNNRHPALGMRHSTGSTGSSPASSIYGDVSPTHSPNFLNEDNFSIRLSPTPSLSSYDASFPSPSGKSTNSNEDLFDNLVSSPLDVGLSFSLISKLNL